PELHRKVVSNYRHRRNLKKRQKANRREQHIIAEASSLLRGGAPAENAMLAGGFAPVLRE
ncbi:MAG TPA: hypothetical protein DDZ84_05100, partial [Firmicutes bacterium]|nr:hypothetical protein [Bacillota bacterium]